MDQSPLPRGSFQVRDRTGEGGPVVPELPGAAVAVEAQYPAHPPGAIIVVDVLRAAHDADGASSASACPKAPTASVIAPARSASLVLVRLLAALLHVTA